MKNMKISMKLLVSFVIVIVLAIIVGAVGIIGMYRMNVADDHLYNGNYLPTVAAGDISQTIAEQRIYMRSFIIYDMSSDADVFRSVENNVAASIADMQEYLEYYKGTIDDEKDQATFDEFVKSYHSEWLPLLEEIRVFGSNNQVERAKATLTAGAGLATKMDELSSKLQQINMDAGQNTVNGNTSLFKTMTIVEIVFLLLAIAISLFLAFYISGLISKPVRFLKDVLLKIGEQGDLKFSEAEYHQIETFAKVKDEVGESLTMLNTMVHRLSDMGEALETVANGDLTVEIKLLSERDTMGNSLHKMLVNLNHMFGEINSATSQVTIGSKQIADGAQSLAQGSTEQASAVQQLSASIADIAVNTKENADMALHAANLAGSIKQNAEKGNMQMDQMMSAVKEINEASQSISKVIGVIDNIAFQTNILALNAAVEAARAGQHGKGFAVVAEEVRSLASKSAEAAKETGALIANSMDKAEMGARIADETAASLVEIVSGINESTRIVSDIASSSDAQAAAITEINSGIDQVAQVVQQNSATAEQSAAASEEMSGQANALEDLIAQFKLKDHAPRLTSNAGRKRHEIPESSIYGGNDYTYGGGMGKY